MQKLAISDHSFANLVKFTKEVMLASYKPAFTHCNEPWVTFLPLIMII